jgi:hypothetical protein
MIASATNPPLTTSGTAAIPPVGIVSVGMYLPKRVLTAADIARENGTV